MEMSAVYISLLDVPFVREALFRAYDLLAACEDADPALVTGEISEKAAAFRDAIEEAR